MIKFLQIFLFIFLIVGCNQALYTDTDAFNENFQELNSECKSTTASGFHEGDGTPSNPYIICKAKHLDILRDHMIDNYSSFYNKHFKVRDNIDYNGSVSNPFYPIGDIYDYNLVDLKTAPNLKPFQGVFDGNGKAITGLYVEAEDISYIGLFQYLGPLSEVKDLTVNFYYNLSGKNYFVGGIAAYSEGKISDINIYGVITGAKISVSGLLVGYQKDNDINDINIGGVIQSLNGVEIGGVVGSAYNANLENIVTNDTVYVGSTLVSSSLDASAGIGGIVGRAEKVSIKLADNYFDLTCSSDYCGGIIGNGSDEIELENIGNYVNISSTGDYAGGIAGAIKTGTLENVNNFSDPGFTKLVEGANFVSGMIGQAQDVSIINSINNADVDCSNAYCGGFAGSATDVTISSFSQVGDVQGTTDYIGGVVGYAASLELEFGSIDTYVLGQNSIGGIVGQSDSLLIIDSTTKIGDTEGTGDYVGGAIGLATNGANLTDLDVNTLSTTDTVVGVNSVGGVIGKMYNSTGYSSVLDDVRYKGTASGYKFVGGIMGKGENQIYITGADVEASLAADVDYVGGIVGYANSSAEGQIKIENSTVSSLTIFNFNANNLVGGVCGKCEFNIVIDNITSNINAYATFGYVGGIAGSLQDVQVLNSTVSLNNVSNGRIVSGSSGSYVGGLVGLLTYSSIINSKVIDVLETPVSYEVEGGSSVGGLVGKSLGSTISKSFSNADVAGYGASIAGLIAEFDGGYIYDSYAHGEALEMGSGSNSAGLIASLYNGAILQNCFSTGVVSNASGGAVSFDSGDNTISGLVWDTTTSGVATSAVGVGYSSASMFTTNPYAGYDFATVWELPAASVYPVHK